MYGIGYVNKLPVNECFLNPNKIEKSCRDEKCILDMAYVNCRQVSFYSVCMVYSVCDFDMYIIHVIEICCSCVQWLVTICLRACGPGMLLMCH